MLLNCNVLTKTPNGKLASIPPSLRCDWGIVLNGNVVTDMLATKLASIPPFAEAKLKRVKKG
jgi:hypothetical protein